MQERSLSIARFENWDAKYDWKTKYDRNNSTIFPSVDGNFQNYLRILEKNLFSSEFSKILKLIIKYQVYQEDSGFSTS